MYLFATMGRILEKGLMEQELDLPGVQSYHVGWLFFFFPCSVICFITKVFCFYSLSFMPYTDIISCSVMNYFCSSPPISSSHFFFFYHVIYRYFYCNFSDSHAHTCWWCWWFIESWQYTMAACTLMCHL